MDNLQAGIDEYLSGDIHKAIKLLNKHIEEHGYNIAAAYYHLGLCYSYLNQMTPACQNFAKATEISPEKSMYFYKLGLAYFRLMALDKAATALKKTIDLNPEHQRSRFLLGQVYFQQGCMEEAETIFSDVITKSPDFADAYYNRALARHQLSKDYEALDDLKKAIEINPDYNEAILEASKINFENSNFEQAALDCQKIYEKGYRNYSFIKYYLTVLLKACKKEEFENLKSEAAVIFPNNMDIENIK